MTLDHSVYKEIIREIIRWNQLQSIIELGKRFC